MKALLLLLSLLFVTCNALAGSRTPPQAAIASAHPLATQAGQQIMLQGGNAFDTAVAITAALAVVEPYSSGLGGGGFWLLHEQQNNKTIMLDGRETAPGRAHRDMYLDKDGHYIANSSVNGPLAAGIPGTVAALVQLSENYGVLSLKQVLQPAIKLAEQGFPVTAHYQKMAAFRLAVLQQYPASAAIFLHNNKVPEQGYLIIQQDLAMTLKSIAEHGQAGFYQGAVAQKMVKSVQQNQGIWQLGDLTAYRAKERAAVKFKYRNMHISSVAPPSSGGIALATMLQILANFALQDLTEVQQTHLIVEAMRRAYRDRAEFLGDSDFVAVPQARLTHPWYAAGLRQTIRMDKALPSADLAGINKHKGHSAAVQQGEGQDTTHFSVLDTQGNMVSATMSINYPFGSGFVAAGTGVLLNDEMDDFSALPGTPNVYGLVGAEANAIAPDKRPLSSMSPTFVETRDGMAILGTPGGSRIITMLLLGILEMEKGGSAFSPEAWVSRPRFHHQYLPDKIFYEKNALSDELIRQLEKLGHELKMQNSPYGNMQAIGWHYQSGVKAASDPRVEGQAIVFSIP